MKQKSLTRGGLYYLVYNVLNLAFPFISGIYVSRKLLPVNIGSVAAAQNLVQYFVILAFLGIPTYGLREIAKTREDRESRSKIFSELYVINFISTIAFLILYLIVILFVSSYREELELYLVVGVSIALNVFNISWLFEGLEEFKFISIRNLVFKTVAFLLLVVLVKSPKDYLLYAGITVFGTAGNYIVNMLYAPRYVDFTIHGLNLRRHMRSILYLVAVNLAIELYSLMDVTMMNFMCSKDSIAFYKYAHNIEKMLLQVLNTFTMVLIPRVSFYYKENNIVEFNRLISKALKLIILVSVPMIVGIVFTADFLITKMYGDTYYISAGILKLFSFLLLISPIGYLLGSRVLLVTGNENKMIISVGIGACVNLVGNAALIPLFAEYGATMASIISEIVVMIVYVNMGKKYFHLSGIGKTTIKVVCASLIIGVYLFSCVTYIKSGWICLGSQIIGAVILYGSTLLIEKEEIVEEYCKLVLKKLR